MDILDLERLISMVGFIEISGHYVCSIVAPSFGLTITINEIIPVRGAVVMGFVGKNGDRNS